MTLAPARTRFALPPELSAGEPPEARGLRRDQVRLLVADATAIWHARFHDIGRFLSPGDLLVVNTSATVPAAVDSARAEYSASCCWFDTPNTTATTDLPALMGPSLASTLAYSRSNHLIV